MWTRHSYKGLITSAGFPFLLIRFLCTMKQVLGRGVSIQGRRHTVDTISINESIRIRYGSRGIIEVPWHPNCMYQFTTITRIKHYGISICYHHMIYNIPWAFLYQQYRLLLIKSRLRTSGRKFNSTFTWYFTSGLSSSKAIRRFRNPFSEKNENNPIFLLKGEYCSCGPYWYCWVWVL